MYRRWLWVCVVLGALLAFAGCGRVNLQDLTPEAVRTANASKPSPGVGGVGTPGAGGNGTPGAGAVPGNVAGGRVLYGTWCAGCHDSGRQGAPAIKGKAYQLAPLLPMLRGEPGNTVQHPSYKVTELSDKQLQDVLAFVAQP